MALIRDRKIFAEVHDVYMEESPRIQECYTLASAPNIVVVPFFISDGLHSFEDIPVMLGAAPEEVQSRMAQGRPTWVNPTRRQGKSVFYSRSIGDEPYLAEVILERVEEGSRALSATGP